MRSPRGTGSKRSDYRTPRRLRTVGGILAFLAVLLGVSWYAPASAEEWPDPQGDGTYVITPTTNRQVTCQPSTTADHVAINGVSGTTPRSIWFGCYFDPSIPASRIAGVMIQWKRADGLCGSELQTLELIDGDDLSLSFVEYTTNVYLPGDPGPSGAPLPAGALYAERIYTKGSADCFLDPAYDGYAYSQLNLISPTGSVTSRKPSTWSGGTCVPQAVGGASNSDIECYLAFWQTEESGPSWPIWRYSASGLVRGWSNACGDIEQFEGPDPADVLTDGEEVTVGYTWSYHEGAPLAAERIQRIEFDPGDGGPKVTAQDPSWLIDEGSMTARFTFTKNGDGTLGAATLRCLDGAGLETVTDYPDTPEFGGGETDPGELTLSRCVGELLNVGLHPKTWVGALVGGIGCVIQWAFVVPSGDLQDYSDRMKTAYEDSGLNAVTDSVAAVEDSVAALDAGTGPCGGPSIDIEPLGLVDVQPLSACEGSSGGTFAPIIKGGLSAALVLAAVFAALRMLSGAFGFQDVEPYWDWDNKGNTAKVYDYT